MTAPLPVIVPNVRLDFAAIHGPEHLRPIYRAIRHGGCDHLVMVPGGASFRRATDRPLIALIGDDLPRARGPRSFHRKSLRRLFAQADHVSLMLGVPIPSAYARAASHAVTTGEVVVILETQKAREREWVAFVNSANPRLGGRPIAERYEVRP